jgi:hypothetical protein
MTASCSPKLQPFPRGGPDAACFAAPGSGDVFATRLWYDTVLGGALPAGARPVLATAGPVALPLLQQGRRLSSLTTPYTLLWRPLVAPGADAASLHAAGRALGTLLRLRPPTRLEAMAPDPALDPLLDGLRAAGLHIQRYAHFGNWHEALPAGTGWAAYLEARPPALRTTIRRKLARAGRELAFETLAAPGPALDAGIAAYETVRAGSWKPHEPFPDFDAALMRAAAGAGLLRLGVLRRDGAPVAAQYWLVDGGRAFLLKLAHLESERAASPGTALTALMIRDVLDRDGATELDFGRGDDAYKRLWVTERRQRIGVMLTDPRHPLGLVELARQAAGALRRRLRRRGGAVDA